MSEVFFCTYRGQELLQIDCRCRGKESVFACAHPENQQGQATRFASAGCCESPLAPQWNCTDCLIRQRISIRTGFPPEARGQRSEVGGQRSEIPTHHTPLSIRAGRGLTVEAQRRHERQAAGVAESPRESAAARRQRLGYADMARDQRRLSRLHTIDEQIASIGPTALTPLWRRRIDPAQMLPSEHQFNASLVLHQGRRFFCYRRHWSSARLVLAELGDDWRVLWNRELNIPASPHNWLAQEDPRLFVFGGRLHVAYTGVWKENGAIRTSVCYALLTEDGQVEEDRYPHFERRQAWEKNWTFFAHGGELLAVYSMAPHRVLRIAGARAELVHESEGVPEFAGGIVRGGASPVLWRGEWYSFFHGVAGHGRDRVYSLGLYTFEDRPPFRVSRIIRQPLLLPTPADRPYEHTPHCIYPAGALCQHNQWVVSLGYYDRYSELAAFDYNYLELALAPVETGPFAGIAHDLASDPLSPHVWRQVFIGNEYELPADMSGWRVVDVGGHIGSFTCAALARSAAHVTACEAYGPRADCLARNTAGRPVTIHRAFVVGQRDGSLPLPGDESLAPLVRPLAELLPEGPIDLLKLDCEGAEYSIVEGTDLSRVRRICGEAHRIAWRGRTWSIEDLCALLARQGFTTRWELTGESGSTANWLFWADRKV